MICLGAASCDMNEGSRDKIAHQRDTLSDVTPASLVGQVYFYAPELDIALCQANGACDCCSGQILFLNDSDFVLIDYCESDADYNKGTYGFVGNNLVLTTDSICVRRRYNWGKETDTTGEVLADYFITDTLVRQTKLFIKRIAHQACVCFLMVDSEEYYVTPNKTAKLPEIVAKLKNQGVLERLNTKYP